MNLSDLKGKSSLKIPRLSFFLSFSSPNSKWDWRSYIVSIAKTVSMKFLFPEVALYLYKSIIELCMEYFCHVWASTTNCWFHFPIVVQILLIILIG